MRVRGLHGWSAAAMVAVAAVALAVLLDAFAPLAHVWAAYRVARVGGSGPHTIAVAADTATFGAVVLARLVAGVCVLVWLYRAYANLPVFGDFAGARPRFRPSLAVAVWFVPIVNWWLPARVVADLARCSAPPDDPARGRRTRALVWAWWAAYLAATVAAVAALTAGDPPELRELDAAVAAGRTVDPGAAGRVLAQQIAGRLPGAVFSLVAAVLLLVVIDRITAAQDGRLVRLYRSPVPVVSGPPFIPTQPGPMSPAPLSPTPPAAPGTATGRQGATIAP